MLAPLVATIAEQAETIGTLRAELEILKAAAPSESPQAGSGGPIAQDPTTEPTYTRSWRSARWLVVLAMVALAIVAVVALLAWPR